MPTCLAGEVAMFLVLRCGRKYSPESLTEKSEAEFKIGAASSADVLASCNPRTFSTET